MTPYLRGCWNPISPRLKHCPLQTGLFNVSEPSLEMKTLQITNMFFFFRISTQQPSPKKITKAVPDGTENEGRKVKKQVTEEAECYGHILDKKEMAYMSIKWKGDKEERRDTTGHW